MDLKKVQNRLKQMGSVVASILECNNIPYMITFGTLLGAVRHGGFIPWDDDFDMFLFDDSYRKAIDTLRNELPDDMFVEDSESEPLYFHGYAHIKDLNTIAKCTQFPHDEIYEHKGLSIDLYRAIPMKDCDLDEFLIKEHLAYIERRKKSNCIDESVFKETREKLLQQLFDLPENHSSKQILGMALPEKSMNWDDVFPLKKIQFEDTMFYGPSNVDEILRAFYGDYMTLPELSKRCSHYDDVIFIE